MMDNSFFLERKRGTVWKDYLERIINYENDWDYVDYVEAHAAVDQIDNVSINKWWRVKRNEN